MLNETTRNATKEYLPNIFAVIENEMFVNIYWNVVDVTSRRNSLRSSCVYMRCASQHKLFVWQLCRCARTPFGCISSRLWYSYLIVIFNWLHCCCAHVFVWPIYHENHKTKSSISCWLSFRNTRTRVSVCVSTKKCLCYHLSQQKYLFLSRLHGIRLVVHSFLSLFIVHCILIHKRISSLIPCAI